MNTIYGKGLSNKISRGRAIGQYYVLTDANSGTILYYFDTLEDRDSGDLAKAISKDDRIARERWWV